MAEKQQEMGMADVIVGQATRTPTSSETRKGSKSLMSKVDSYSVEEVADDIQAYVNMYLDTQRSTREPLDVTTDEDRIPPPRSYADVISELQQPEKAETLKSDEAFMTRLAEMQERFPGLKEREIFKVIEGESAYNTRAVSDAGAVGLFQMMPKTLAELGFTSEEVLNMDAPEQLAVYESYLKRWDYDGSTGLGIIQAAPAYRNASPDTVIYPKGSKEWEMNKGWRERGNGPITKRSIEAYYGRVE